MSARVLDDRYELREVLGRGGMAAVWRAWDLRLERPVAVKVLDPASHSDPLAVERFHREARTVAGLSNPHIVAVHDFGTDAGTAYLVMELVDGESLATLLGRGPLPVGQAVEIAAQTCDALAAAHAAGVVHRDIKPGNLLVTPGGEVKVCDFGIARLQHAATGASLTGTAMVVGTSNYMAPEQASGDPTDARTDLYALGCVLYGMLAGTPPFLGVTPMDVLDQHLHRPPPPLRLHRADVPPDVERLVQDLLAKDPAARPADAGTVGARLATLAVGPEATRRSAGPEPTRRPAGPTFAAGVASPPTTSLPAARTAAGTPSPTQYLPKAGTSEAASPPPRRRRAGRATVAVALAVAALVAVALLVASLSSLSDSPGSSNAAGQNPTATGTAASSPSSTPSTQPLPPLDQIAAIQQTVSDLADAGQLYSDAAKDLRGDLSSLARDLRRDRTDQVGEKIDKLLQRLDEYRKDDKLTEAGYQTLAASLQQLAASVPAGG